MSDADDFFSRLSNPIPFDDFKVQGFVPGHHHIVPVDDAQAEYWTIIGYISGQQVCGIGRFASREEAENKCRGLYRHGRSA